MAKGDKPNDLNGHDPFEELLEITRGDETRDFDLGEIAKSLKGKMLKVYVNKPGILQAHNAETSYKTYKTDYSPDGKVLHTETIVVPMDQEKEFERLRKTVSILFQKSPEEVSRLEDHKLIAMFNGGMAIYNKYHQDLKNA